MGQGNDVRFMAMKTEAVTFTDYRIQFFDGHDLGDRQFADGQNKLWFKELQFCLQPGRAIADFILIGNPISAARVFSGETAAHCRHIDCLPESLFLQTDAGKPAKQRFACRPGKRPMDFDLPIARCLADQ